MRSIKKNKLKTMKNTTLLACLLILLLSVKVSAQLIYTDLNPDTILAATTSSPSAQFDLDLNNDGTVDFNIRHNNFGGWIEAEFYTQMGQSGQIITNGTGAATALDINDNINSSQSYWVCTATSSSNSALFMNSNGADFPGQGDKFVGLRIKVSNQWHYGWVSLSIPSDESQIIIKGYAYNQSNTSIYAGQTITGINEPSGEAKNIISVYPNPFNSSATIQFNSTINNAELNVYNLYGQKIKTMNCISGDQMKIERENLNSGIYLYELKQDSKNISTGKLIITD